MDKLTAMGIKHSKVYVSGEDGIQEQKPSEPAMKKILQEIEIPAEKLIYIGDRDEKDRKSADIAGVKYFDINDFRNKIKRNQ